MDLNVFCTDGNYYFKLGISKMIEGALLSDVNVKFLSGSINESLQKADLILINYSQWRLYMCHPAVLLAVANLLAATVGRRTTGPALLPFMLTEQV